LLDDHIPLGIPRLFSQLLFLFCDRGGWSGFEHRLGNWCRLLLLGNLLTTGSQGKHRADCTSHHPSCTRADHYVRLDARLDITRTSVDIYFAACPYLLNAL
jgi:hypothetical protein